MGLKFVPALPGRHTSFIESAQAETFAVSFGRRAGRHESDMLSSRVSRAFHDKRSRLVVLEDDDGPKGYFWLELRRRKVAFLLDLYVVKYQRRRRLGGMLLEEIVRQAVALGAVELRLAVALRNAEARRLFSSFGLQINDSRTVKGARWFELRKSFLTAEKAI